MKNRLAYSHGRPKSTTTPYVYLITHKTTGKRYYGVRFCSDCDPSDLWTTYFTSSKIIHQLIDVYDKEDFICEIRKTFPNKTKALAHEFKVLRRMQLHHHQNYLNRNISTGFNGVFGKGEAISIKNVELNKCMRWPIDKEIPFGWERGNLHSKTIKNTKGTKWYHDPFTEETRMFKPTDDIPPHYLEGRPKSFYDNIREIRKFKKYKWINNKIGNKMILVDQEIPHGWKLGKIVSELFLENVTAANKRTIGVKCITNGIINKRMYITEILPEGFYFGRTVPKEFSEMLIKRNKSRAKKKS